MNKKRIYKHKFSLGGITNLNKAFNISSSGPIKTPLNFGQKLQVGTSSLMSGPSLGGIINTGASAFNTLINPSGNTSKVGNTLSTIGSTVSNIPGIGGVIGAGVNALGGLWNAAFGSNINEEFVKQTEDKIQAQNNYVSNATTTEELLNDWMSHINLGLVDQDDVGSDGWFSNKAKNKTKELNAASMKANLRADSSIRNTNDNIQSNQFLTALSNYKSYGGPLDILGTSDAIDYELAKENLGIKEMNALNKDRMTSLPNSFQALNTFAKGGKIHIKKANRGKFTKYCGGKVTSECIARGKRSSNPAVRKRATFAANARKWKHAFGGDLLTNGVEWSNGLKTIDNGGTHEENPMEGVPMGIAPDGQPNLVEEGEVIYNNYVFSNRMFADKKLLEDFKLPKAYDGYSFAAIAERLGKESKERPNDPISKRGLMSSMTRLQQAQETMRQKSQVGQEGKEYAHGGKMGILFDGEGDDPNYLTYLRYAPILGSAIGLGYNIFSKPDYSGPDAILEAAEQVGNYTPVGYTPIGNYLTYRPLDRNYYINKLNAQAGATRRAILNTSSPSRNVALLAADYNALGRLGDLARQAEEYNLAQRERVEGFNRQTNMANAEMGLKASMANQEAALKAKSQRLSGVAQAMAMRDTIDSRRGASMSANLTNFFNSLGDIGREEYSRNMIMSNPALYYSIDSKGNVTHKNGYENLSEAEKKEVRDAANKAKKKKAKGGYLTIKKK